MPPNNYGKLGLLALLSLGGNEVLAQAMPALRVDPALLGQTAPAQPAVTSAGQSPGVPAKASAVAIASTLKPCAPVAELAFRSTLAEPVAPTGKLPALRVDPALLGAPPTRTAPTARIDCVGEPQPAAGRAAPVPVANQPIRARGTALSSLPKDLPRIPVGNPEETVILADSLTGSNDKEVVAKGNVQLTKGDTTLETDLLVFRQTQDEVEATGNVRLLRDTEQMTGPHLKLQVKARTGAFDQPSYQIQRELIGGSRQKAPTGTGLSDSTVPVSKPTGRGQASRLLFEGDGQYRLQDATYSTCTPNTDGSLDWYAKVSDLKLDYASAMGDGHDATVYFKNTPILYTPWISFPLNNERKSGLLTPTIGSSSNGGLEYTQPIYWNIAPNMDATFSPRLMSKRGIQLRNELRYLERNFAGQASFEILPRDQVTGEERTAFTVKHLHDFGGGFAGSLDLSGVSDDTYFKDLTSKLGVSSKTNLLRQGVVSYGAGWWSASLMAQSYQTLQDPSLPTVAKPYERLPQLNINAVRADLPAGLQFNFAGEAVNFTHPTLVQGARATLYPQLSLPYQSAAFFLTPKIGVHSTTYSIDSFGTTPGSSPQRSLPIVSVDSGLFFERPSQWFGKEMVQTLEPRLYYLYIPDRDQSAIPVFDSGIADFNFAQIFSENRYVGGDRIADANQLTGMVSSRLIDPDTGAELIRAGFGQRIYFTTQHVGLPGETLRTQRSADLLAAVTGQISPRTYIDTAWQYNPNLSRTERFNIGARYQPEIGKVINAGYRFARAAAGAPLSGLGQIDISAQWPLGNGWHGVGRYNYSTKDHRVIETIGGLEYDGGCWVMRGVVQRTATLSNSSNATFFIQLELKDFSRLGSNPLDLLKRSVPGYGNINSLENDPTFAAY